MTLVTIDLGDVAGGHDPDDHVVIRAEAFRESPGGGITSTAEVKIPLVNGVGQAEVEPGPVVVSFRCQAVADTREKRGVVPSSGTVGIERVLEGNLTYTPPVVDRILEIINGTVDSIKWERPAITSGTDLNLVLKSGSHAVPSYAVAETLINRPQNTEAVDRAELRVFGSSSGIHQTWTPIRPAGLLSPIMHRRRDNVGTWTQWVRLDDISSETRAAIMAEIGVAAWLKSALTGSEDLNDLRTPGMYRVSTYTIANRLTSKPELKTAINPAILEVKSLATGQVEQVWTTLPAAGVDAPVMSRRRDNGGVWTPWERIDAAASSASWLKRALVEDEDLDSLTSDGLYRVATYRVANSLANRPTLVQAVNPAIIEVRSLNSGQVEQIWTTLAGATTESPIMRRRRDNEDNWTEWERIDSEQSADPMLSVGMSAVANEGEARGLRTILRGLSTDTAPVWAWWAPPATELLTIPTHDGSGQTCHPSVLYFPDGWNGWKYWMVHTPYPNFQERHEDPNIAVSNDGTTWQVPEGLTNPLDDAPGRPDPHNSDGHLAMMGSTMVCTWRTVDRPNGGQNIIYARTSTDGVTWTPKVEVLKVPLGVPESTFVSQALVKMPVGWRMYGIHSVPAPNRLGYYETSVDDRVPVTADWGPAQTCDIGPVATGRDPWHVEVQRLDADDWVMVMSDGRRGTTGVAGDIFLGRSTDGVTWDVSPLPLTSRSSHVLDHLYKTGFVVSGTGASRTLDLFVSGYRSDERTWGTYRTQAAARLGPIKAPTLADVDQRVTAVEARNLSGTGFPEGKVVAPVGATYVDQAATNGAVRWIKTTGTGNTGWQVEYGDTGTRSIQKSHITSGTFQIKRYGPFVTLTAIGVTFLDQGTSGMISLDRLPPGFRAAGAPAAFIAAGTSVLPDVKLLTDTNGYVTARGDRSGIGISGGIVYATSDPWPSTLPGTPL